MVDCFYSNPPNRFVTTYTFFEPPNRSPLWLYSKVVLGYRGFVEKSDYSSGDFPPIYNIDIGFIVTPT